MCGRRRKFTITPIRNSWQTLGDYVFGSVSARITMQQFCDFMNRRDNPRASPFLKTCIDFCNNRPQLFITNTLSLTSTLPIIQYLAIGASTPQTVTELDILQISRLRQCQLRQCYKITSTQKSRFIHQTTPNNQDKSPIFEIKNCRRRSGSKCTLSGRYTRSGSKSFISIRLVRCSERCS